MICLKKKQFNLDSKYSFQAMQRRKEHEVIFPDTYIIVENISLCARECFPSIKPWIRTGGMQKGMPTYEHTELVPSLVSQVQENKNLRWNLGLGRAALHVADPWTPRTTYFIWILIFTYFPWREVLCRS